MMPYNLSNEEYLIILCCCIDQKPDRPQEIQNILSKNLDWDYIIDIAERHTISPLLYKNLSSLECCSSVPPHIFKKLARTYNATAYKNLFLISEYQNIMQQLSSANIKVMPFKGIAFLQELYSNVALRVLADIDLLVPKDDLARAQSILQQMGFTHKPTTFYSRDRHFHLIFYKKINAVNIVVELHWDIDFSDSPYKIKIDDFLERAESIREDKFTYYRLALEDSILLNSFHLLRDPQEDGKPISLKNLCDISEIINVHSEQIQWDILLKRAETYGILRLVLLVLLLIKRLSMGLVPDNLIKKIYKENFHDKMLAILIHERIFIREKTPLFFPSGLNSSKGGEVSVRIKPATLFKTIYITLRTNYDRSNSLAQSLQKTFIALVQSFSNYCRLIYLAVIHYDRARIVLKNITQKNEEIKAIDSWLRS